MKTCELEWVGTQEGFGALPSFDLFNIVALSHPHPLMVIGSTVTVASVIRAGFEPVIREMAVAS
jgi:hypothetical protein